MSIRIVYYISKLIIEDPTIISDGKEYIGKYDCGKITIDPETGDLYVTNDSDTDGDINVDVGVVEKSAQ